MNILKIKTEDKEINKLVSLCINSDDFIKIITQEGSVIMMKEQHFKDMLKSLEMLGIKKDIDDVINTPTNELSKNAPWD